MIDEKLAFKSATELVGLIKSKQVSPVELTSLFLERIERINPLLNSFLLVTGELAMEQSRAAEAAVMRGDELGALHGVPVPIKDTQMTAGVRTTMACVIYEDHVPEHNAAIVERVLVEGAVMLGKTNASEMGFVGTCENSLGVLGRNPWDTDRTPGGSSGGAAAAVAARLCPVATGGDGGGSLRIPSSLCGVYAIKPTLGRVSGFTGVAGPRVPNLFSQPGPIARTVADAALLLGVMSGFDPRDPISIRDEVPDFVAATKRPVGGCRVAWSLDFGFAEVDEDVAQITESAARVFEELGCEVDEIDIELLEPYDSFGIVQAAIAYERLAPHLDEYGDRMTAFGRYWMERGSRVTVGEVLAALGRIEELKAKFTDVFAEYDLLLSPVARFPAFRNEEFPGSIGGTSTFPEQYWNGAFTMHANATGNPAASVPAGFTPEGLPVGLQIIGRHFDEEGVLAASAAFERARPWIDRVPPVASERFSTTPNVD